MIAAAQKTLENLFGGMIVIGDSPIRIGHFCRVGTMTGTVEDIGLRSTRIRTLARTVISNDSRDSSRAKFQAAQEEADKFVVPNEFPNLVEQEGGRALLLGDAEERAQRGVLDVWSTRVEMLKVAHHGSPNGNVPTALATWARPLPRPSTRRQTIRCTSPNSRTCG